MQVYITKEKVIKNNKAEDVSTLEENTEADDNEHEAFIKKFAEKKMVIKFDNDPKNMPSDASECASSSVHAPTLSLSHKSEDEAAKFAIKQPRKAHSRWDRQGREFKSTVEKSKVNENTQGSKIERELDGLIATCTQNDNELREIEQKWLVKGKLTTSEIEKVAQLCTELKKIQMHRRRRPGASRAGLL